MNKGSLNKSCVVITTVNRPTPAILKYIKHPEINVIIVADEKTPASEYEALDCIFLSLEKQRSDFHLLYVPSYVSFRFCDVLKMYIAQAFVAHGGRSMAFQGATVFHDRNPHDCFKDYLQECEMYVHVERLVAILEECLSGSVSDSSQADGLIALYERLVEERIVRDTREIPLLKAWLKSQGQHPVLF